MARTDTLRHFLTDIANSIRNKKGTTDPIMASDFDTEIDSIETSVGKYAPRFISFRDYNKTDLDYEISNIDTSNVTDMRSMFNGCSYLTSLDLSNFDTSNVVDMSSMFSKCSNLTSLDLSNFNTSNVTDMHYIFNGCSNLTYLDIRNFDFTKVISDGNMFDKVPSNCEIIVKDDTAKKWIFKRRSDFTNVKTVVEKEAEIVA